ncbi:MAG: ribosome silencing factor [Candidatus Melainabacteria bacterium]|nr:ribosome silencing factor [Candidatus Melainabacteria bacterium]
MTTEELAYQAARLAEEKKGIDTEILDITKVSDIADYIIITAASSRAQLKAIAAHIEDSLAKADLEPSLREGKYGDKWFVLDYLDFVVHIIDETAREFYNLEELWAGAMFIPREEWDLKDLSIS